MSSLSFNNSTIDLNGLWFNSHVKLIKNITRELNVQDRQDELIAKFLGDKMKIKKRKDPNLPKKPLSSFLFFCNEHRNNVRIKNPDMKMGDVMKKLGEMWGKASKKEKEKFTKLGEKAKEAYSEQMEQFNLENN
jgi:hypothetical protein